MKLKLLPLVLLSLLLLPNFCHASMTDCLEATCLIMKKVEAEVEVDVIQKDGSVKKEKRKGFQLRVGTGVIFHDDEKHVYILTAGHVVSGRIGDLYTLFFKTGKPSSMMKPQVLFEKYRKNTIEDVAILSLEKKAFGDYPIPKSIPISNEHVKPNQRLISAGCPSGNWPNAFIGSATMVGHAGFRFIPRPTKGRSGSGIFDDAGTKILGVLILQGPGDGIAISTPYICRLLGNNLIPKVPKKEPEEKPEEKPPKEPEKPVLDIED